jgi:SAM-dependent methyltransferase
MDHSPMRASAVPPTGAAVASLGYPLEAVEWTVGRGPARVLELVAGEGELTPALAALGNDVLTTDPSAQSVARLAARVPAARTAVARAEDIPLPAASVDVVVAGAGFRVVDSARALPEVARVLRPGGVLSLIWNSGDHKIPWVRKMFALMGVAAPPAGLNPVGSSDLFALTDHKAFRQWQRFDRDTLVDFVASSDKAAALDAQERASLLAEAAELYDGYGRGPDGLLMPWLVDCYRARVKGVTSNVAPAATPVDDGLLIDFS